MSEYSRSRSFHDDGLDDGLFLNNVIFFFFLKRTFLSSINLKKSIGTHIRLGAGGAREKVLKMTF